ncbi:MAG: hypothetical protein ABI614_03455, partial [Planctomycetota bacterium]
MNAQQLIDTASSLVAGDTRPTSQPAIERWENEGGLAEIEAVLASVVPAVRPPSQSPKPPRARVSRGVERRLPIEEPRRIRNERPSKTLTQAEGEAAICDGIMRFQEEY